MHLSTITKNIGRTLKKRSPEILTGIGIAGMVATTIMAVQATPKALQLIEEKKQETGQQKLTVKETVKVAWKPYVPAAITSITSIACLIGASSVNVRRNAALATAYTISETALRDYKEKVVETIGEKKEKEVRDAVARDQVEKNPVSSNEVVVTGKGDTLCYDPLSGRYFKSSIEKLKRAENEMNRQMLRDGAISLNELYYEIGLDEVRIGNYVGWNAEKSLIDMCFSSQLASDGTPCVVMDFAVAPQYGY